MCAARAHLVREMIGGDGCGRTAAVTLLDWHRRRFGGGEIKIVDVGDTVVTLGEIWIGLRVGYCGSMPWKVNFHYWNCRFFCDTQIYGCLGTDCQLAQHLMSENPIMK